MKESVSSHCILHPSEKTVLHSPALYPCISVSSGVQEIDTVLHGFQAGQITYIQGASPLTKQLPYQICVNTYKMFQSPVLFIDGGNQLNPYHLARYARYQELSVNAVLAHVQISRAFTVYQLNTLINQQLEPMITRHHPQTLIINAFPLLYMDTDVNREEARGLLTHALTRIQQLTKTYQLITVLTHPYAQCDTAQRTVSTVLLPQVDDVVLVTQMKHCPRVSFPHHHQNVTITEGMKGQLCLVDFGMVM